MTEPEQAGGRAMRLGVISDSHGDLATVRKVLTRLGQVDLLVHAGDHYEDALSLGQAANLPVQAVRGNCDYWVDGPGQLLLDCAGKKLLVLHGHQFNVKRGYTGLINYARKLSPDLVVFGHTHIPSVFTAEGITFFNPGSLSYPRGKSSPSYGIIEIDGGKIRPSLINLSGGNHK